MTDGAAPTPLTPPLQGGARVRRRFGPLFYVTAAIALVVADQPSVLANSV